VRNEAEVVDPFAASGSTAGTRRGRLWTAGLLGAWALLTAGLCDLIAEQLPDKPLPIAAGAVVLAGLGALLGLAVNTERRAADRRLRSELGRASKMLRSVEAITDPGLAFLGIDELLGAMLERTKEAIGGDVVSVFLADANGTRLHVRASAGMTALSPVGSEVLAGDGVLGTTAQVARPAVVPDVRRSDVGRLPECQSSIASLMVVPLIVQGTTLGIVEVASVLRRTFGVADLRLLQVASDRLATAFERARLDDLAMRSRYGVEHASMHLRVLARGGTVLGKALESYDTALDELAEVIVPELADWFGVHVLQDSGELRCVASRTCGEAFASRALLAGRPSPWMEEVVREAVDDRRPQFAIPTSRLGASDLGAAVHVLEALPERSGVSSMLVVPVHVRGSVVAALSFATGPKSRGFRPSDLETARELAERVGVTIDRVRSWWESQRAGETASQYAERLRRLMDASLVVNAQFSEEEVIQLLVEHTHRVLEADVVVLSAQPSGGPLAERVWPPDRAGAGAGEDLRRVVVAAVTAVAASGEVVRSPEGGPGATAPAAARGWVAAPITDAGGEVRRVVVAAGEPGTRFSIEDESVVTLLAQMTSVALRNARLYAEVLGNEQRLQTLVDSSPLAIAELQSTGEAAWWNRAAADLFGWSDRSGPRRIPVREGSELVLAGLLDSAFGGKPIIGVAVPVTGAGGELRELSVSASPLGALGTVSGVLVVAEDVTERQRMLEQFHQAERLNAMSRMAGAVAHDFNNLLTVILGCSDVLLRRLGEDQDLAPDVAAIHRAGTRAAALTNQLVRIGGNQQPVQPELVVVDEVVASMQPMLSSALGSGVRLEIVPGAGATAVLVDRSELERSVLNLAINARDAMPAGGTFTIESACAEDPSDGEELLELSFTDTGIGMDEETLAHCFEPFFTRKGRARGTGLGLAVVHATVSQAGGEVRVESAPGVGARFTLTFPVGTARAGSVPRDETCEAAPFLELEGGGETVLVVDDELEVLRLEVRELKAAGYQVLDATNASEALHLVDARGGPVHLLVTDVVMPGMNGIELATAVRWRYPEAGVLFVSGHLDDAAATSPLGEQGSLLTKPFGPDELTRRVRDELHRARASARERGVARDGQSGSVAPATALQGSKR
jgi:PAS domain S-box-containing protein